jgi:hypothetical protein
MVINFHYLTESQIAKWSSWIKFLVSEAPALDTDTIPEVSVYPTLLHSFQHNFMTELVYNDKLLEDWYNNNVWAYAVILEGGTIKTGRKIALCVNRLDEDVRTVPIEFNFLHEIGHFNIMRRRLPDKFYLPRDEDEANRYALIQLVKILKKYPNFKTHSQIKKSIEMEAVFRKYIVKHKTKSAEAVASIMIEALGWKMKT